jgi:hypothetical protein
MTFKQSKQLDILLKDFLIPEYVGNGSLVAITSVTEGNEKLKNLSDTDVSELLLIIKSKINETGIPLIIGNFGFTVYKSNIKIFLKNGGFVKCFWKERLSLILLRTVQFIAIFWFLRLIFLSIFPKDSRKVDLKEPIIETIKSDTLLKTISRDSLPNHYLKTEKYLDSLKRFEIDSLKSEK